MTNRNFFTRARSRVMPSLFSALWLAFSASTFAGANSTALLTGNCYVSGNTEICYGTMAGIRNQTGDPSRSAQFSYTSAGDSYFYMSVNGANYYCSAPPSMNDAIKTAMASSGYFVVYYDISTSVCTYLVTTTGSPDKNASAL